jgi:TonB family protein
VTTAVLPQDNRRLQGATAFSFGVHGLLIGLYLFSHITKPKNEVILQEVEFFDLKPAPVEEAALPQAQQPPRSFKDFFKMAAKPLMPQEAPQEAPRPERTFQEPKIPEMQRLVGKTEPLDRAQNIKLDARLERSPTSSSIGEITTRREVTNAAPAEMVAPKDAINIEAVGRRAVAVAGPALKIDAGASGPARGGMRDFPTGPRTASTYSGASPAAAPAIAINEASGPARRGGMPGGSLPIGYNRGGSIQLSEKPVGRPQNSVIAAPAPAKPKPAAELAQASGAKKGAMDISGPLAGRKVITLKMPSYPAWAREKNVEAEIAVRFFVDADGAVLTRMFIERSSGYKELDDLCLEALKQFVFAPLTGGATEEQWGIITFRFKLS